jgi:flagellar basal-body rod protein FlgB
MQIFSTLLQGLGTAVGLHEARHHVLTQNVANVETPGYRARDVDFGSALEDALSGAVDGPVHVEPTADRAAVVKADGNSVDLDFEMARLSENTIRTVALSEIISRKYAGLKRLLEEVKG